MSESKKGLRFSAACGENHPNFGKNLSEETKKTISDTLKGRPKAEGAGNGMPSQAIEVIDLQEKTTTSYNSIREAARALNINQSSIVTYFIRNQQKPYKGRYTFKKIFP
jgi:group I intron endonuclease